MPQVPYRPYPTEEPAVVPTPSLRTSASPESFGAAQARALQGLGGTLEKAGDEVAKTVLAQQAIVNDTWAKEADIKAMDSIGKLDADYKRLEGVNAWDAKDAHMAAIQKVRKDTLDSAPNPAARRMADQIISRRVGFALVDAGNYAGNQLKVADNNASEARKKMAQETFDPEHPDLGLKTIDAEVRNLGRAKGAEKDTVDEALSREKSTAWLNGLTKLAPHNPQKARDIFEANKDSLDPQVRDQIQNRIDTQMALKGTDIDAQEIMKDYDPQKGPGELDRFLEKAKAYKDRNADNPYYGRYLDNKIRGDYNLGQAAYRDAQVGNLNTVEDFVHGKSWDQKITDMNGVIGPTAPPEVRAAYEGLDTKGKRAVEAYVMKDNKIAVPYTRDRQQRYWELMGESDSNPQQFLQRPMVDEDLPRDKIDKLLSQKRILINRSQPDTGLQKALSDPQVKGLFDSIYHDDTERSQHKDRFVGAMNEAMNEWKAENPGKALTSKDYKELAQKVLQEVVTTPGWRGSVWGQTVQRRYEVQVPADYNAEARKKFRATYDREPTPEEVRGMYLQQKHFPRVGE
jgi:hypothetical protein